MPISYRGISRRHLLRGTLAAAVSLPAFAATTLRAQDATVAEGAPTGDKRPILHPGGLRFGCYDPHGDFTEDDRVATEHLFLPWEDVDLSSLPLADAYAHERGRDILVTVEPWSWAKDWNVTSAELRELVLSGQRDANMRAVCQALATFRSPVTIRWAQEMDNPFNRFTWSDWSPQDYIAAFRRIGAIARDVAPSARMMWSPRGEPTLQKFYPGDEHVDLVGLTVFGLDRYDMKVHGRTLSFPESVRQGYELVSGYGKPVWVAELGYAGSPDYVASWMDAVTRRYPEYPQLEAVVYFNDREVWDWPYNLGRPDWRVVSGGAPYPARR